MKIVTRKLVPLLLIVSITFLMSSCKMVQDIFTSKRYKTAVANIDALRTENLVLKTDTTVKAEKIRKLTTDYYKLDKEYELVKDSLHSCKDDVNEIMKTLSEKEQNLVKMQRLLNRQDSIVKSINAKVKAAMLGFGTDELSVEMKNGKVYVSMQEKLLFKSGSAKVEDKGKDALKKLAEVLNKNTDIDILIEGHTDNVPIKTNVYNDNWDLSTARATSIVRILTKDYNVNSKRLTASGRGEFYPVASNEASEGRAKNRRTEIILSPKLEELYKLIYSK